MKKMAVTMELIKELRARTGIGMMECKKALTETDGDMDAAIEELRKKGLAKAAKKADREALEGGIKILCEEGKAYVISISCETDFLAISDKFKAMLDVMANYLKDNGADSKEAAQEFINSDYADKLKQVAMHVTAANPEYLSPEDISEEVVEKEKQIQLDIMKNDPNMGNKSDDVLLKIIGGKMGKFKSEISLLEQAFVIDPNSKVKDFLGSTTLTSFKRFSI
jgi:elongation factor Ts